MFDFDGLILDTETPIFASWSRVFEEHASTPLTMDEWSSEIGTVGGVDLVALFQSRAVTDIDVDEMQAAAARAPRRVARSRSRATGRRTVDRGRAGSRGFRSRSRPARRSSGSIPTCAASGLRERVRVSRVPRSRARGETRSRRPIWTRAPDSVSIRPPRSRSRIRRTGSRPHARPACASSRYRTRSPRSLDLSHADLVVDISRRGLHARRRARDGRRLSTTRQQRPPQGPLPCHW